MRVIIAGSRFGVSYSDVVKAMHESGFQPSIVLCGEACGADKLGKIWANSRNIPVISYPALWDVHGRKAGILRNIKMVDNADALVAVWSNNSTGTKHVIEYATKKGLKLYVYIPIGEQNE